MVSLFNDFLLLLLVVRCNTLLIPDIVNGLDIVDAGIFILLSGVDVGVIAD